LFAARREIANQLGFHTSVSLDRFLFGLAVWFVLVFWFWRAGVGGAAGFLHCD